MKKLLKLLSLLVMVVISSGCDDSAEPAPPLVDPFEVIYSLDIDFVTPEGKHLVNSIVKNPIDDVMKYSIDVDCDTFLSGIGPSTQCHSTNAHLGIFVKIGRASCRERV